MTLDFSKPVQTRDGRKVRIFTTDYRGFHPIIGAIQTTNGDEFLYSWDANGRADPVSTSDYDLINVSQKFRFTRYVNVYKSGDEFSLGCDYSTHKQAVRNRNLKGLVATIPVVIEGTEGDGL